MEKTKRKEGDRHIKASHFQSGVLLVLVVILLQCAPGPQVVREREEDVLRRRVQEYLDYEAKGQWDRTYALEAPEYREKVDLLSYIKLKKRSLQKWEAVEILEVWTVNDEGNVKMNVKYRYLVPNFRKGTFERTVEEKWVRKNNQWYHSP